MTRSDIRLALPSKGRLESEALDFLAECGLRVYKPNPRQYQATLPALPGLDVLFQRPGDIVTGVRQGSLDFGITGLDMVAEKQAESDGVVVIHDDLAFGRCRLALAVPEAWTAVQTMRDLQQQQREMSNGRAGLRVATKFPALTARFLAEHHIEPATLINAEGTLEVAPAIGYADLIADLVSTGTTLRDNRLRLLDDGVILRSQAVLIGNRLALQTRPELMALAREMLEYVEAHLRAQDHYLVTANVRGESAEEIAGHIFAQTNLGGLQGPTIAPVFHRRENGRRWFSVTVVVRQDRLTPAMSELRHIGGSGVIVSPLTYIFEEEPARYRRLLAAVNSEQSTANSQQLTANNQWSMACSER
jgi:ATP phosphoribosyltransferase